MEIIGFDSHEIKELHNNISLKIKFDENTIKQYGKQLLKKFYVDEKIDYVSHYNVLFREKIPLLKRFNYSFSKYNGILLFSYHYYTMFDNNDEFLIEINIEKENNKDIWTIETIYSGFLESKEDKDLVSILTNNINSYNQNFNNFNKNNMSSYVTKVNDNLEDFFSKWIVK